MTVIAHYLGHRMVLADISKRIRFVRRRFGHYDLIDFVVVRLRYAISGERTLEAFYEHVHLFAAPFMALFGREGLPHRSTLSRFLAALEQEIAALEGQVKMRDGVPGQQEGDLDLMVASYYGLDEGDRQVMMEFLSRF